MLKQYSVLSKCLFELKKSDLPLIEKLRIEVQLIQTKRILLDHRVENSIAGALDSEHQFNHLYDQLRLVCGSGGIPGEIERLKELIRVIKEEVSLTAEGGNLALQLVNDKRNQGASVRRHLQSVKDAFH
jgi:hypothetical protein